MAKSRMWFEIVSIATTTAFALALLFATLGAVAGALAGPATAGQSSLQPPVMQAPRSSEAAGVNSLLASSSAGGME